MTRPLAVHAVTRRGALLGRRLADALGADLLVAERFAAAVGATRAFPLPMRDAVAGAFRAYAGHVFVLAAGATVRLVAPLLADKRSDPAVVCIDEAGRFAVALLCGHRGGANALAGEVARATGAVPVVTTASDVQGTLAVDLLGRELGFAFEDPRGNATRAAAAVVNGEPVLVVQEAGSRAWWPAGEPLPANVVLRSVLPDEREPESSGMCSVHPERSGAWRHGVEGRLRPADAGRRSAPADPLADASRFAAILVITDRAPLPEAVLARAVLYRPPTLAVGVGCDRGAPAAAVERALEGALSAGGLARASVAAVASIDLKGDEPAILALAAAAGRPLRLFPAAALDAAPGIERPSAAVQRHVGTRGVSEPAALLAAGATQLLVPKQVHRDAASGKSVTVAIARIAAEAP